MDNGATETSELIRTLSLRQRIVSLAVVILALVSLALGWQLIAQDEESDELINLAGRQRMLSQRMALYLTLSQQEPDAEKQQHYRTTAITVAADFDQAHARLARAVAKMGAGSPIHSLYFGPTGNIDADSRLYLSRVRESIGAAALAKPVDARNMESILAAADSSLLKQLDQATALYQSSSEEQLARILRLLQISTLLIIGLLAFGTLRIFRPVVRRLMKDVTSRDQEQRELKESQASLKRLELAIEQSPVSIMIIGSDGKIIYVNSHFSSVTGYSAGEAVGTRPKILLWSGETPESTFAEMRQALKDRKTWRGEVCGRAKSGALFWETLSVSPVCDDQGRRTHHIAVSEDITAQRRLARREHGRNRILEAIATGAPLSEALSLMVAMAEAELPGALCALQPQNPAESTWHAACSLLLSAAFAQVIAQQTQEAGAGGLMVEDIGSAPRWQAHRELAAAEGLRTRWAHPVASSTGTVLGTLSAYYGEPRSPGADEIRVIEQIASLAAICLEKYEAEQSLRLQEAQTRKLLTEQQTILGYALVGIVYLKHRIVISCNRRLEEIFGYDPGELIGKSSAVFYETLESFDRIGDDAYRVVAEGRNYSTELILKHRNGSLFHGALNGCALDPAHPHEGSIWVYADISERYHAEQEAQKLLQAVEQSPASIVITSPDGLIEYVNPRFTRVTGYTSHEVVGQNPRILQSGETPPEVYQELWQTLLAGKEWRGIVRNRRKNGELFWEEASISPIIDDAGRTTHYLAVKEDITERKRIEDELEQHRTHLETLVETRTADLMDALQAAKVADQAKDAFLANVSHELRTPLNAVIGLSELARRISTDPKQQDYLDKVTGAGRSLAGIINDLLDLSKISAGHMEFESSSFSLHSLVQRSRSVMAHRADEKGLKLLEQVDAGVPDVLLGDPLRIEQILLNLLSNAIKFTSAGRVEVRIGLQAREADRVCLRIEIEDTGIGLAEESLSRLFQPFAQADASMSRKFGGTGLGLALSRRLAEMMGGDISVTSQEGVGTTFCVRIWLGLGAAADLPETADAAHKTVLPVCYRNVQILVVDDQPLNREIVEALLATVGITSRSAADGQEALDILREAGPHTFDLVLMDIQMPIVDGLTATREIRGWSRFDELPIIAMTAHTMEHEKTISTAAGMNDHIGKPFETANFFQLLARWIPAVKQQMPTAAPGSTGSLPAISDAGKLPVLSPAGLPALPNIDTEGGLARFVGNEQRYRHWLLEFVAEAPDYATQIRQNLADGNQEAARKSAHAIKGRVGMLGMTGLHPIVTALEVALKTGEPATDLLARMETMAAALCKEIQVAFGADAAEPAKADAPDERPAGPPPESVAQLLVLLQCADGDSAAAAERCLAELQRTAWAPRLQLALARIRQFDFEAALKLLAPDDASQEKVD